MQLQCDFPDALKTSSFGGRDHRINPRSQVLGRVAGTDLFFSLLNFIFRTEWTFFLHCLMVANRVGSEGSPARNWGKAGQHVYDFAALHGTDGA